MTFKQYDEKGVCRICIGLNETTFYNEKGEVTLTVDASNPVASEYHTQPKREWVGLTDEERQEVVNKKWWDWEDAFDIESFARAIEAKLKEKNT